MKDRIFAGIHGPLLSFTELDSAGVSLYNGAMLRVLRSALLSAPLLLFASCASTDYGRLPETGFISHYRKNVDDRIPFVSYWDKMTAQDWDVYVSQPRVIYLAPVTLEYMDRNATDATEMEHLLDLRDYFDAQLDAAVRRKADADPNLTVVRTPVPGAARVEVAILSVQPVDRKMLLAEDSANLLVNGVGLLIRKCWGSEDDMGHIAMGARFFNSAGELEAEVADFEYGMTSVSGALAFDTKDFRPFAYQKQTIDHWAEEFATLATTPYEKKVHRPRFSFSPF